MNIVLGVDGGSQQPAAVALAAELCRESGATLTVVNVFPWSKWAERLGNAYELTVREDAEQILRDASSLLDGVPHEVRAIPDVSEPKALHAVCEDLGADLLVIGACHRGPVGRAVLGGVGDRVVHGAPCPVAVAPRDFAGDSTIARIGVGYDDRPESRAALDWAIAAAEQRRAELVVLGVVEGLSVPASMGGVTYPYDEVFASQRIACRQALEAAAARIGDRVTVTTRTLEGPAARRLIEAADGVDLLVLGSRGYGPLRAVLLGSAGRAVSAAAPCPVVLVPRTAEGRHEDDPAVAGAATV